MLLVQSFIFWAWLHCPVYTDPQPILTEIEASVFSVAGRRDFSDVKWWKAHNNYLDIFRKEELWMQSQQDTD
jgi:hypothetical protein